MGLICVDVVVCYLFNSLVVGVYELMELFLVILIFLVLLFIIFVGEYIEVELFDGFKSWFMKWFGIVVVGVVIVGIFVFVVFELIDYV